MYLFIMSGGRGKRERESESTSMSRGQAEKEGENLKQAPNSAQSLSWGSIIRQDPDLSQSQESDA